MHFIHFDISISNFQLLKVNWNDKWSRQIAYNLHRDCYSFETNDNFYSVVVLCCISADKRFLRWIFSWTKRFNFVISIDCETYYAYEHWPKLTKLQTFRISSGMFFVISYFVALQWHFFSNWNFSKLKIEIQLRCA